MTDALDLAVRDAGDPTGRPIARFPEHVRRALGVLSGDTVIIDGDGAVVATVWPARGTLDGDAVELDAYLQRKANAPVGTTVTVRAVRVDDATTVVVRAPEHLDADAVHRVLRDRPVEAGDHATVDDSSVQLIETRPAGLVRVTEDTTIQLVVAPDERAPIDPTSGTGRTYDDIGGLDAELDQVREAVELPIAEPDLFAELGIRPPTGVLLYGPPGTGKTLIAEAVATAVDATFIHVSGPEITSKYKGESEEHLRELFARAREAAPSIIFFDEIDAIAAAREGGSDMETRIVAQLLSLLDGIEAPEDVIVVAATNRIDTIDPALRRPGRFDREIEIGVPDAAGRREILEIHADPVPLADDVDLDDLAARTHGFVGADLRALVTEAAMLALRRTRETDDTLLVQAEDFETALASIDPSAMREFVAETPAIGFDAVGGLEAAKAALREAVEWPLTYPDVFDAAGTDPPAGVLLYGPPGTGKTLLARALAGETEVNFIHVAGPELLDKYVGESERAVREVFERARQTAPTIVFFDEIDALAGHRGTDGDVAERVVSQLLTELDGLAPNRNLVVLAATNRFDALDPALLRPGRLETHIEVPVPDEAARREIITIHTKEMPLASDVDLDRYARALDGYSGAEIAAVTREAAMTAIREFVTEFGDAANRRASDFVVADRHFQAAMAANA